MSRTVAKIFGFPIKKMPAPAPRMPQKVIVCEIAMEFQGEFSIDYSKIGVFDRDNLTIANFVAAFLANEPSDGTYKRPKPAPRRSTLSLFNDIDAYVVFILNRTMEKWRFSKGVDPFSLYVRAADIYYAPTRLGDKAACFIALAHGSDEISEGGWGDRFNLHLDLMQKGDRYIPIIIDPDIGHPGGHRP